MPFKIFLGSQLLAITNMIYLSYVHYNLKFGMGEKSLCNINDTFNCDIVNLSSYATLFGIPISLWGFFSNLTILFLGLLAYIEAQEIRKTLIKSLNLLFASFIVLVSIFYAMISFFVLETYCLFCLFAYILSFISLGALIKWRGEDSVKGKTNIITECFGLQKEFKLLLPILLIIPITLVAHDITKTNMAGHQLKQLDALFLDWRDAPSFQFQTGKALIHSPARPAKMTILEFADFGCPACKAVSPILHNFVNSRDDVQFIFMFFPLDGSCNEAINRSESGRSCWLASATYCANQQGKGWEMHDQIFELFYEIKRSDLTNIAQNIGLDHQIFSECLEASDTLEFIKSQARQGEKAKITGTPSIFVNGRQISSGASWIILERIYNSL